ATFHILHDDSVGADFCTVADDHGSQNLGARADIDMIADHRQSLHVASAPNCNLLKNKAIKSNLSAGVDHDSVRVRDQQTSTDVAIERNVSSRHDAPKSMTKHDPFSNDIGQRALSAQRTLVGPHAE